MTKSCEAITFEAFVFVLSIDTMVRGHSKDLSIVQRRKEIKRKTTGFAQGLGPRCRQTKRTPRGPRVPKRHPDLAKTTLDSAKG